MATITQIRPQPEFHFVPNPDYLDDVLTLHQLGWNVSAISRYLHIKLDKPVSYIMFKVKHILELSNTVPMSFLDLNDILPYAKFIDEDHIDDLFYTGYNLTRYGSPDKLSPYDIQIISILAKLSWKKTLIAQLYQVSATLISMYTQDLTPWTVDELKELFPELFNK